MEDGISHFRGEDLAEAVKNPRPPIVEALKAFWAAAMQGGYNVRIAASIKMQAKRRRFVQEQARLPAKKRLRVPAPAKTWTQAYTTVAKARNLPKPQLPGTPVKNKELRMWLLLV